MIELLVPALRLSLGETESHFFSSAARQLHIKPEDIKKLKIVRRSLDARKKEDVFFSVHCLLTVTEKTAARLLKADNLHIKEAPPPAELAPVHGNAEKKGEIIVCGFGPAGIFAAWLLAREGYKPIVLERGQAMEQRTRDVESYWQSGRVLPESNPMFGEGGAGAFSDGKLTSRSKDPLGQLVLERFVAAGAPEEILYAAKPHLGTDTLRIVIAALRREILSLGGEVRFGTRLKAIRTDNGAVTAVTAEQNGIPKTIPCCALVLAIGQGARDTYQYLFENGFALAPKPFAVGVRAEHPQSLINESQYKSFAGHPALGAAEYRLTAQDNGRGVYTFCMCPGGFVVGAASAPGEGVVNGMSYFKRDGENANAAVVVQVSPEDFGTGALDGMRFQQKIEQAAFRLGGGEGLAPAQRVGDFLRDEKTVSFGGIRPTFRPGVTGSSLSLCLPGFITHGIKTGLVSFGRQLKGYACEDAVLTAAETRTSAPLRILRDENGEALLNKGVYPVGEGAGYAGGIVSAAIDGLRAAERIIKKYRER